MGVIGGRGGGGGLSRVIANPFVGERLMKISTVEQIDALSLKGSWTGDLVVRIDGDETVVEQWDRRKWFAAQGWFMDVLMEL